MNEDFLIIFIKAPQPGQVKTRLAKVIGVEAACRAYEQLVVHLVTELAPLKNVELYFTPAHARSQVEGWLQLGWKARPQTSGHLGSRLAKAFADAFRAGAGQVVIIGSDCPWIKRIDIEEGWKALRHHDAVIGPAEDGGYWLIGLRTPCPKLLEKIPWSTGKVLSATLGKAAALKLKVKLLRRLIDVDSVHEWRHFQEQARQRRAANRSGSKPTRDQSRARGPKSK